MKVRKLVGNAMRLSRRKSLHLLAAATVALPLTLRTAWGQGWPNRVVRIVVPLPPGGGADAVARILAKRFSKIWGEQVIVENKSGAAGDIAFGAVAHAAPDGYTILMNAGTSPRLRGLFHHALDYDPQVDFAPVTMVGKFPFLFVVPAASPFKTLKDFISFAKAHPGKISYAAAGVGSLPHLCGELLERRAGFEMTHVPYRGLAAGELNDLVTGRIDAMFNALASLLPPVRAGQVRALGVTTAERFVTVSDLPTFNESGVPGFDVAGHYGLYVPAKTPPEIVRKVHDATVSTLKEISVKAKFEPLGTAIVGSTPAALAAADRRAVELFDPIIKSLGI
jgi:tripartite-type tricarboxylate transporter receptor subunit TctC